MRQTCDLMGKESSYGKNVPILASNNSPMNIPSLNSVSPTYAGKLTGANRMKSRADEESCAYSGYFEGLQTKFPDLNLSAGESSGGSTGSGVRGNVLVSPKLLDKAARDPAVAAQLEKNLSGIPDAEKWIQNQCAARGMELVAGGVSVDEDGNMSSWSVVTTAGGSDKSENLSDDEEDEKRLEEKRREQKVEEKSAEETESRASLSASYNEYDGAYGELVSTRQVPWSLEIYA